MRTLSKLTLSIIFALSATLTLEAQVALNPNPIRVVGQTRVDVVSASPNLAEAKDLYNPSSVALDTSTSPPAIYVADPGNNRVLGWRNTQPFNNGAPADIVIGQRDFLGTAPGGPGTRLTTGLFSPGAVAVDATGNVYVADSGNNRILRYPRPFAQNDALKLPDMVIGQQGINTGNQPNTPAISAATMRLNSGGVIVPTGLLFDTSGNLWFSDAGNNRVLRYPKATLDRGLSLPLADTVVGQSSFTANTIPAGATAISKGVLNSPSGLAFDNVGRLYVCDSHGGGRVMVFSRPVTGAIADRIMGLVVVTPNDPVPPEINDTGLGRVTNRGIQPPRGVFFAGGTPYVLDTANNRIMRYDPVESWPPEATRFSPQARFVYGQVDFTTGKPNRGQAEASNSGFDTPVAATVAPNGDIYLVDLGNHRVMVFAGSVPGTANRLIGQSEFFQTAVNNIDGREMFVYAGLGLIQGTNSGSSDGGGVVIDKTSNPPRLYVADTYNNRILGFRDVRSVKPGDHADIVIGQRDFQRAQINNPTNDPNQLTDSGLYLPAGLAVDAGGNLYVSDAGNGRVLRFQRPFDQPGQIRPDLVLGQATFFAKVTDATNRTMNHPYGLAFTNEGHLLVSDIFLNRVLLFKKPAGGDFTNGQAASQVFGQPDFASQNGSSLPNGMIAPHGISTDSDDRLYVADTGNSRVLIYDTIGGLDADAFPSLTLPGLNSVHSVFVNPAIGEIWVAATGLNQVLRYPSYFRLLIGSQQNDYNIPSGFPLGVTLDSMGNPLIMEGYNRVSLHFPLLRAQNGANKLLRIAPYTYVTLSAATGASFGDTTLSFKDLPDSTNMPLSMGDVQVLLDDAPAPIQSVSPEKIEIITPRNMATSTTVSLVVTRQSTGQVLAGGSLNTAPDAPALFTVGGTGSGQVMAKNPDGTANSAADRVGRNETISLFGTGFGPAPDGLDDGVAAGGQVPGSGALRIVVGTDFVPNENITYFGLAPGMVGIWQIDVKIPDKTAPEANVLITCQYKSTFCTIDNSVRVTPTIAVKP